MYISSKNLKRSTSLGNHSQLRNSTGRLPISYASDVSAVGLGGMAIFVSESRHFSALACAKVEHQFDCVPVPYQLSRADMGTIMK